MKNDIENLLILQNIDSLLGSLRQKLTKAEKSIALAKEDIVEENKKLSDFESKLKESHAKRASLKLERESLDEKLVKYKIQHATLKKNDEYQAMQLSIDRTVGEISKVEETELEVLFEIDDMEAELSARRASCENNIAKINQDIASLEKVHKDIGLEIAKENEHRTGQAKSVAENFYTVYERLIKNSKKQPIVVEVKDSKCSGCHLKISVSLQHASEDSLKSPVTCEHCGRILYS